MANLIVYEFGSGPDAGGNLPFPADKVTTTTTGSTITLDDKSKYVMITADSDCRVGFNAAAQTYSMPILSAVANLFLLKGGTGRTLSFA